MSKVITVRQLRAFIRSQILESRKQKLNEHKPVAYTHSDGYALCADCHGPEDMADHGNEAGTTQPIYSWDEFSGSCDGCGAQVGSGRDDSLMGQAAPEADLDEGEVVGDEYLPDDNEYDTQDGDDEQGDFFPSDDEYSVGGPPALPKHRSSPPPLPGVHEARKGKKKPVKAKKKPVKAKKPVKEALGDEASDYVDDFDPGMETPNLSQLAERLRSWHDAPLSADKLERLMEIEELAGALLASIPRQ